jgi:hypothetical protein
MEGKYNDEAKPFYFESELKSERYVQVFSCPLFPDIRKNCFIWKFPSFAVFITFNFKISCLHLNIQPRKKTKGIREVRILYITPVLYILWNKLRVQTQTLTNTEKNSNFKTKLYVSNYMFRFPGSFKCYAVSNIRDQAIIPSALSDNARVLRLLKSSVKTGRSPYK